MTASADVATGEECMPGNALRTDDELVRFACVAPSRRVQGLRGLQVVDASVKPTMMFGEKGATEVLRT